jgi:hypothetical protein
MSALRTLAAILGAADGGDIDVPRMRGGDDWEPLLELAGATGLMPALWSAAHRLELLEPVPVELVEALGRGTNRRHAAAVLQLAHSDNAVRNADLLAQFDEVVDVLTSSGIPVVALKGAGTIAMGVWPDPADRVMRDIDVLVPADSAAEAQARLLAVGYGTLPDKERTPDQHHLDTLFRSGRRGSVEIHRQPLSRGFTKALPGAEVLAGARPVPGRSSVLVPSPAHTAAIALVHAYLADGQWRERTVPLRSVHELWRFDQGEPIDWNEVRALLERIWRGQLVAEHLETAASLLGASRPAASLGGARARMRLRLAESRAQRAVRPFDMIASGFDAGRLRRYYGTGIGGPWRLRAHHIKEVGRRFLRRASAG